MKIVNVSKEVKIEGKDKSVGIKMDEGKWYVISDTDIAQLRTLLPDKFGVEIDLEDSEKYRKYNGEDLTNKTIVCFRTGGIGDLLFMTPSFRFLKKNYSGIKIVMCAGFSAMPILENNPHIDELHYMPFDISILENSDYHLHFQGIIEDNPSASKKNAYDLFFDSFYIKSSDVNAVEDRRPIIKLTDDEIKFADDFISKVESNDSIKVGIQIRTSTGIRAFPINKFAEIIRRLLIDERFKIFVFAGPRDDHFFDKISYYISNDINKRVFLSRDFSGNLREAVAIYSRMNFGISPDSAMIHVAGAFNIPQIGLYGPFPSRLRMLYYEDAIGLNASVACSPCFKHGHYPCEKGDPSPCFSVLDTKTVIQALDFIMEKKNIDTITDSNKEWRHTEAQKTIDFFEYFMVGKGLDIGCGYFKHDKKFDIERLDHNPFVKPDILSSIEDVEGKDIYNFVFDSFCLHECSDKFRSISVATRILKPGGYLCYYIPHKDHYPNSSLNEEVFSELISSLPVSIQRIENRSRHSIIDYPNLNYENDEYAFSVLLRKDY